MDRKWESRAVLRHGDDKTVDRHINILNHEICIILQIFVLQFITLFKILNGAINILFLRLCYFSCKNN